VKTLSSGLQVMAASRVMTLAFGMRVERADGEVTGWTDHPSAKTVTVFAESLTLEPTNAVVISSIARSMGMGVDNLEAEVLAFDDVMTKVELLEGRWDGARFYIFQFNFVTPSDGLIPWISGKFGNMKPKLGSYVIELRDLRQELQNDVTRVVQANCDYRLGDDNCTVDLDLFTFTGAVTDVSSNRQFTDATFGAVDADYYTEGEIEWLTGLNAGLRFKVYTHADGGVFTLDRATLQDIVVTDTFSIVAGCRKRRIDCRDKFDNVLNFPGADTAPTTDDLTGRSGGAPSNAPESPLVTNPDTPEVPAPGAYNSNARIVGLDYTQTYDAGNVSLMAGFPLVIRSFSTSNAATHGTTYVDALQALNPDIEVANYVILNELDDTLAPSEDYYPLLQEVDARNWWARVSHPAGAKTQWTTLYGKYELNMTAATTANGAGQRLPQYKAEEFDFPFRFDDIPEAGWVFIDNLWRQPRVTADYNCDGTAEAASAAGAAWRTAFVAYINALKALRPGLKIIGNVNHNLSDSEYVGVVNAGFDEGTIGKSYGKFATGGIAAVRNRMLDLIANTADGMAILNAYGSSTNYQRARLGFTMAQLFDAHFCYLLDVGTLQTTWFDEYEQDLGTPTDAVPSSAWSNGVWARRFENGVVLCNPTGSAASVNPTTLGTYTRFLGTQDATTNSGASVSGSISIPSQDGIVLLTV
jgi:uncharacterized phage protein (TIGR02218 family)